jgi:hypothetical protein
MKFQCMLSPCPLFLRNYVLCILLMIETPPNGGILGLASVQSRGAPDFDVAAILSILCDKKVAAQRFVHLHTEDFTRNGRHVEKADN